MRTTFSRALVALALVAAAGCSSSLKSTSRSTTTSTGSNTAVPGTSAITSVGTTSTFPVSIPGTVGATTVAPTHTTTHTTAHTTSTSSAATSTTAAPTSTTVATPRCDLPNLGILVTAGEAAAGTVYYKIVFTNTTAVSCKLSGHPGVSFLDSSSVQIGIPAKRTTGTATVVLLAPGAKAHAVLAVGSAGNFGCAVTTSAKVRVYPPGSTHSKNVNFVTDICNDGIAQSTIDWVLPGAS
jgi:hypothetical protein